MPSLEVSQYFLQNEPRNEKLLRRANLYAALSTTSVGTQKSFYDRPLFEAELTGQG